MSRLARAVPLAVLATALCAATMPARAEPLADITDAARVVFDGGQEKGAKAATAGRADTLRDGAVGGQSVAFGSMDVSPALFSSLAYRGFTITWEWQQPQTVAAIDLFLPREAPDGIEPLAIKVLGQAEDGGYVVRLFHTEDARFKPAADWRDAANAKAGARHYRVSLHQPFTTRSIKVIAGAPGGRAGVGEMRVLATEAAPAPAKLPPPIEAGKLVTWFGSPWTQTNGGTKPPTEAEKKAQWSLRMSQNDTEQAMIGLLNTGTQPASVEVSLQGVPKGMSAELLAVGAIEARGRKGGKPHTALMNLFTPAQVQAFHGFFPEHFVRPETWAKFPSLALPPGQPVYVWLRLSSRGERPSGPGGKELAFMAKTKDGDERQAISVDILKVTLPERPVVQSWTYGVVNDDIGRHHYNTVNGGYRYFTAKNLSAHAGLNKHDMAKLHREDPEKVRKIVRAGVDTIYSEAKAEGYDRDQVIFVIYDEVRDAKAPDWVVAAREVRAYQPDATIIANPAPEVRGMKMTLDGTIKQIAPFVDIWEPHLQLVETEPAVVSIIKATGKPFWFYKNVGNHISRNEGAVTGFYRTAPWTVLKLGMDGACFWAAGAWFGDMWNDFDRDRFRDWADAAVSFEDETHSAITTRNLEAWREGLEDVAIGRMLQAALDRDMLKGSDAAAAQAWLGKAPDRVLQTNEKADGRPARDARDEALDILNRNWSNGTNLPEAVEAPQALRS